MASNDDTGQPVQPVPRVTATDLIHHGYEPPGGFKSVVPGIFKASTVIFENTAALRSRQWKDKSGYTYGLHGTPEPGHVGKTESHGCVRMTNWDALRVADAVDASVPVIMQE